MKTKKPTVRNQRTAPTLEAYAIGSNVMPPASRTIGDLTEELQSEFMAILKKAKPELAVLVAGPTSAAITNELHARLEAVAERLQFSALSSAKALQDREARLTETRSPGHSLIAIAENMERSVVALGPALAEIETPVSPQLARSMAATERAWRGLEAEFGMLTSLEVSEFVGSKSPNRSYASEQRSKGKLIAVKRPGGLLYPGFQIDRAEHCIRPVMAELIDVAEKAGRSESSLALWMTSRTGYLDGDRPVDHLSQPDKVIDAAVQAFGVQW